MEQPYIIKCSHVGKFITHNLMRHKPPDQDTGQEANEWQQQLSRHKIEQTE